MEMYKFSLNVKSEKIASLFSMCAYSSLSLQTIPKLHSEPVIPPGRLSLIAQLPHIFFS